MGQASGGHEASVPTQAHHGSLAGNWRPPPRSGMPEPMRFASFLGLVALAVAMGALVVGRAVVLPELGSHPELLDANFAKAVSAPIHLRLAEIVLGAHLLLAAFARPWVGSRWATTVALVLVGASAVHRFALLPTLYDAWARADLVAGRPVAHILEGQRLELQETVLIGTMLLLQLVLCGGAALSARARQFPSAAGGRSDGQRAGGLDGKKEASVQPAVTPAESTPKTAVAA